MKIQARGVGQTARTCALLMALTLNCGGEQFAARAGDELERDAGDELGAELERDAPGELVDEQRDAGDELEHDAGDGAACDLRPCECNGVHVALCCSGPCPSGFEGLSCYCGDCPFGRSYDAGHCY